MYPLTEACLITSLICLTAGYLGALVFGSGVVALLVVRMPGEQVGGLLLRAYWPCYRGFHVVLAMAVLVAVVYALPGQFTFWPTA